MGLGADHARPWSARRRRDGDRGQRRRQRGRHRGCPGTPLAGVSGMDSSVPPSARAFSVGNGAAKFQQLEEIINRYLRFPIDLIIIMCPEVHQAIHKDQCIRFNSTSSKVTRRVRNIQNLSKPTNNFDHTTHHTVCTWCIINYIYWTE